jgi:hypothetical protein
MCCLQKFNVVLGLKGVRSRMVNGHEVNEVDRELYAHKLDVLATSGNGTCRAHGNNLNGYEGQVQKYGILRSLRYIYSNYIYSNYIYSNPLSFLIYSLGLPKFSFSEKLRGTVG